MNTKNLKSLKIVAPDKENIAEPSLTPRHECMEYKNVDINETDIKPGLEWFVFKKRPQKARRQKFSRRKEAA